MSKCVKIRVKKSEIHESNKKAIQESSRDEKDVTNREKLSIEVLNNLESFKFYSDEKLYEFNV